VAANDIGLELRSPFLHRNIGWLEISDFFPAGTLESQEFVLLCRNGEEFYLSNELTESSALFDLINNRIAKPEVTYESNYRLPDSLFDSCRVAAPVTVGVGLWAIGSWLLDPVHAGPYDPANLAWFCLMTVLWLSALAWCWLQLIKLPQLIRVGRFGIYIKTGTKGKVLA
jgi:hypothetical protein